MSEDPGPCCCSFADFYESEGLMPPIHNCPAPAPLTDDFDGSGELTDLERSLLLSLNEAFGRAEGTIKYLDRRR